MKFTAGFFNREKRKGREEFFAEYVRKNSAIYIAVTSFILVMELVMIVRGLFMFDFGKIRHVLYFSSYVFLICVTVPALVLVLRNRKSRVSPFVITLFQHLYCVAVIAWALFVSYLDMEAGNSPIVYLTVIISTAGLSLMHPVYYASMLLVSGGVLFSFDLFNEMFYFHDGSRGVVLNLLVYAGCALLLVARQYRVSRAEYEMSRHLEFLSFRDQLTGLFNRRRYDEEMARIVREDSAAVLGMIDIDLFKRINDSYGHDFGDECLRKTAAQLSLAFGERVYRIGGDEFAVICDAGQEDALSGKVEELNRSLEEIFPDKNITVSAGFCPRPQGSGITADELVYITDSALYSAKKSGRRRSVTASRPVEGIRPSGV